MSTRSTERTFPKRLSVQRHGCFQGRRADLDGRLGRSDSDRSCFCGGIDRVLPIQETASPICGRVLANDLPHEHDGARGGRTTWDGNTTGWAAE